LGFVFAAFSLLSGTLGTSGITAEAAEIIKSLFLLFLNLAVPQLMLGLSIPTPTTEALLWGAELWPAVPRRKGTTSSGEGKDRCVSAAKHKWALSRI
jgi:uncharacterized membrane protein YtjA (UPF0391 family)